MSGAGKAGGAKKDRSDAQYAALGAAGVLAVGAVMAGHSMGRGDYVVVDRVLYGLHVPLEAIVGVVIGKNAAYPYESAEERRAKKGRSKVTARYHAAGLTTMAALGALVLIRGHHDDDAAALAATVLAGFHGGCSLAALSGLWTGGTSSFAQYLANPHTILGTAFLWRAATFL